MTLVLAVLVLLLGPLRQAVTPPRTPTEDAVMLPNGLALPYPPLRVFRGMGRCTRAYPHPKGHQGRWRTHDHEGIDLGGIGPDGGNGSAIRSLAHARVVSIALGTDDPVRFGAPDLREGTTLRYKTLFERSFAVAGYGLVRFFSQTRGWWKTGNMVVTEGIDGPLAGHTIRYLHLGAPRPDLKVGDELAPGEEVGVLGGTAVMESEPHLHLDVFDPEGEAVDVAPLIGLPASAACGIPRKRAYRDQRAFHQAAAGDHGWRSDLWAPPVGVVGRGGRALPWVDLLRTPPALVAAGIVGAEARFWYEELMPRACGTVTFSEDFSSGAYQGHALTLRVKAGQVFDVTVGGLRGGGPRYTIIDQTAGLVARDDDARSALTFTRGPPDARRRRFETRRDADVIVAVHQPDPAAQKSRPTDYRLTLTELCKPPAAAAGK